MFAVDAGRCVGSCCAACGSQQAASPLVQLMGWPTAAHLPAHGRVRSSAASGGLDSAGRGACTQRPQSQLFPCMSFLLLTRTSSGWIILHVHLFMRRALPRDVMSRADSDERDAILRTDEGRLVALRMRPLVFRWLLQTPTHVCLHSGGRMLAGSQSKACKTYPVSPNRSKGLF